MEIAVIVLLISTLTSVGLVALWAATSHRPWYLRATAPVAMIAPLALVPALEPLAALSIEAAVVAARAWAWRRSAGHIAGRMRFSMATLLAAMTLVAVGLALLMNPGKLNDAWQSVAVIGLGGAAAVLLGAWAATVRGYWVGPAIATALLLSAALGAGVARADWFAPSMMYSGIGWPPQARNLIYAGFLSVGPDLALWMWYAILPSVAAATFAIALLERAAGDQWSWRAPAQNLARRAAAALAVVLSTFVALPAAAALYEMLTPDTVPVVTLPQPNAYDDVMAAGARIGQASVKPGVNFYNFDPYYLSRDQLASALAKVAPSMRQLHDALRTPCLLPINYGGQPPLQEEYFGGIHCLRQALAAEGRLAELDGDLDRCLAAHLDAIQLGFLSRRGGLLSHCQAGAKGTGGGVYAIQRIRGQLSKEQCLAAVARIESLETAAEPFDAFAHRDFVHQLHGRGWHGRLYTIVRNVADPQHLENYKHAYIAEQAKIRLFKAHLWLRAYLTEHDALPPSWNQVTQAGLPALPVDPWNAAGGPLRYKRNGAKSYQLYSVGPNGIDDSGAYPLGGTFYDLLQAGDYQVDMFGRDLDQRPPGAGAPCNRAGSNA